MTRGFLKSEIQGMVREIEPNASSTDLDIYSILLASVKIGAEEGAIANALDLDEAFVRECGERARKAHIWEGLEINPKSLESWRREDGAIALACDVNILDGTIEVAGPDEFALTEEGRRRVEHLLISKQPKKPAG